MTNKEQQPTTPEDTQEPAPSESPKPFEQGMQESLLPKAKGSGLNRRDNLLRAISTFNQNNRRK